MDPITLSVVAAGVAVGTVTAVPVVAVGTALVVASTVLSAPLLIIGAFL